MSDAPVPDLASVSGRLLVVMRHAKAESWGADDRERPLADRGREDAAEAGAWLAGRGFVPDAALVSSATRTRQTFESLAAGGDYRLEPTLDDGLYSAGPETVLDVLRELPAECRRVLLIGHNPTMAYLASILDNGEGEDSVAGELGGGYPTCALTVFAVDGEWSALDLASVPAIAFHVGRG